MRYLHRVTTEKGFIDLHNHTDLSYGKEMGKMNITPLQLLEEMREYADTFNKVVTFSVTDHNDILPNRIIMKEIRNNPEKYKNIRYIPGVEYSVCADSIGVCFDENGKQQPIIKDNRVHLLAYGIDDHNPNIEYLNMLMSNSNKFMIKVDERYPSIKLGNIIFTSRHWLKKKGMFIGLDEFRQYCPLKDANYENTIENIEKYFTLGLGLNGEDIKEWKKFISDYWNVAKHTKADIMEVMDYVEQAGGYSVLAHPLAYTPSDAFQAISRQDNPDVRNAQYKGISFDDKNYKSMSSDEKRHNFRCMENYYDLIYRKLSIDAKNPITGKKIQGIVGHELLHPLNQTNPYKFQVLMQTGDKYGLYATGGSDSHGDLYQYCIPSRIAGAFVQRYDSNYDPKISAYSLLFCKFVDDYYSSIRTGERLDRKLGRFAKDQMVVLKTNEITEKFYNMSQFEEVVFTSFLRKKQSPVSDKNDGYKEAEEQSFAL